MRLAVMTAVRAFAWSSIVGSGIFLAACDDGELPRWSDVAESNKRHQREVKGSSDPCLTHWAYMVEGDLFISAGGGQQLVRGTGSSQTGRVVRDDWPEIAASASLFDSGASALKPEGRKAVQNLAQMMKQQPARGIAVEGYTDSSGSAERNRQISQARAEAVKQVLVEHGIDPNHVWTRAYGSEYPLASKERVDVVIAQTP
jgi:outer membrane protein OmpA-like peptidoglycan-associated protein